MLFPGSCELVYCGHPRGLSLVINQASHLFEEISRARMSSSPQNSVAGQQPGKNSDTCTYAYSLQFCLLFVFVNIMIIIIIIIIKGIYAL